MKRRLQIVEVLWDDIAGYGPEWKNADEIDGCEHVNCRTTGYLWSKGKNLKIVGTITADCGVGDVNVIPAGVVREIKVLGTVAVELSAASARSKQGKAQRRY
jgi:hypothetical protein